MPVRLHPLAAVPVINSVMNWATRKVLAWRASNTMDVVFFVAALEEARAQFGSPEIVITDQGSQFTSPQFTGVLTDAAGRISMDGRSRMLYHLKPIMPEARQLSMAA